MRVIGDCPLRLRWRNKSRDIHYIVPPSAETFGDRQPRGKSFYRWRTNCFYRNKAARLVGKLIHAFRHCHLPIHQTDDGELFIDTCLTTTAEASGFARYFYGLCTAAAALVENGYGKFCG